jgi:hypothetical protein
VYAPFRLCILRSRVHSGTQLKYRDWTERDCSAAAKESSGEVRTTSVQRPHPCPRPRVQLLKPEDGAGQAPGGTLPLKLGRRLRASRAQYVDSNSTTEKWQWKCGSCDVVTELTTRTAVTPCSVVVGDAYYLHLQGICVLCHTQETEIPQMEAVLR